jgi:hypothetical protein
MLNLLLLTAGTWTAISSLFVWRLATAIPYTRRTVAPGLSVLHGPSREMLRALARWPSRLCNASTGATYYTRSSRFSCARIRGARWHAPNGAD